MKRKLCIKNLFNAYINILILQLKALKSDDIEAFKTISIKRKVIFLQIKKMSSKVDFKDFDTIKKIRNLDNVISKSIREKMTYLNIQIKGIMGMREKINMFKSNKKSDCNLIELII